MTNVESRSIQDTERTIVELYHELTKYTALHKQSVSNANSKLLRVIDAVCDSVSTDRLLTLSDATDAPVTDSVGNPVAFANRVFCEYKAREVGLKSMVDLRMEKYLDAVDRWCVLRSLEYSNYLPATEGFLEALPPSVSL